MLTRRVTRFQFYRGNMIVNHLRFPNLSNRVFNVFRSFVGTTTNFSEAQGKRIAIRLRRRLTHGVKLVHIIRRLFRPQHEPRFQFSSTIDQFRFERSHFRVQNRALRTIQHVLSVYQQCNHGIPVDLINLLKIRPRHFFRVDNLNGNQGLVSVDFGVLARSR